MVLLWTYFKNPTSFLNWVNCPKSRDTAWLSPTCSRLKILGQINSPTGTCSQMCEDCSPANEEGTVYNQLEWLGSFPEGQDSMHPFGLPAICSFRDSQENSLFQSFPPGLITYCSHHSTVPALHEFLCQVSTFTYLFAVWKIKIFKTWQYSIWLVLTRLTNN